MGGLRMLPDKPLVSVIVVAYNHERYIREALDSIVIQQVDFDYEVLALDDCSTDLTPLILKEYAKKYPNLFYLILHEKNIGVMNSVRDVKRMCRGKYIAVLEGDDFWTDPLKLQKQVDFMESHSEYSACAHEIEFVDEYSMPRRGFAYNHFTKKPVCILDDVEKGLHAGQTSSLLYKNVILLLTEEQENDYYACECIPDLKLMLLLTMYGPVFRLGDIMSAYRYVTASNSSSWSAYSHNNNLSLSYIHWADECIKMSYKLFGLKTNFRKYFIDVGYHAWVMFLKHPSRENLRIFKEVFKKSRYKFHVILRIICGMITYPYRKIKQKLTFIVTNDNLKRCISYDDKI